MSNRELSEVPFSANGTSYTLVMDLRAMLKLEAHFSTDAREMTFAEIVGKVRANSLTYATAFIWAAFSRHHQDVTFDQVTDLIQAAGGLDAISDLLAALTNGTHPDPADLKDLGVGTRPPEAQAQRKRDRGTGGRSTSTPAESA
jgi:hypothetical protein